MNSHQNLALTETTPSQQTVETELNVDLSHEDVTQPLKMVAVSHDTQRVIVLSMLFLLGAIALGNGLRLPASEFPTYFKAIWSEINPIAYMIVGFYFAAKALAKAAA